MEHYLLSLRNAFIKGIEKAKISNKSLIKCNFNYIFSDQDRFISDFQKLIPNFYSNVPISFSSDIKKGERLFGGIISELKLTKENIESMSDEEWVSFCCNLIASNFLRITLPASGKMIFGYSPKFRPLTHIWIKLERFSDILVINSLDNIPKVILPLFFYIPLAFDGYG